MKYYPLELTVADRKCIVVGGGEVAERKVRRLLDCGAKICVIDRKLTPFLAKAATDGRIVHVAGDYTPEFLSDALLVIGATDNQDVNEQISRDARQRGILVNIVDQPLLCDFILPALLERGDLSIAVSTGGKSPALARRLREDLAENVGPEYGLFVKIMGELREKVLSRGGTPEDHKKIFAALVDSEILSHIKKGNSAGVRETIRRITGIDTDVSF
ncbi:MAG: bifunctional precorrin-2 dehydrogenase/sirohydrochlorin ferrochelatase [Smithellaceae bacterium]|nr:bifunctional precorrin-2 dehydrogenase/sirohydrochlorin ferrochelatase [Smithellaceae bacterium]